MVYLGMCNPLQLSFFSSVILHNLQISLLLFILCGMSFTYSKNSIGPKLLSCKKYGNVNDSFVTIMFSCEASPDILIKYYFILPHSPFIEANGKSGSFACCRVNDQKAHTAIQWHCLESPHWWQERIIFYEQDIFEGQGIKIRQNKVAFWNMWCGKHRIWTWITVLRWHLDPSSP